MAKKEKEEVKVEEKFDCSSCGGSGLKDQNNVCLECRGTGKKNAGQPSPFPVGTNLVRADGTYIVQSDGSEKKVI